METFVSNRISEVQRLTLPKMWCHIPGNLNLADVASRGALPSQLHNSLW